MNIAITLDIAKPNDFQKIRLRKSEMNSTVLTFVVNEGGVPIDLNDFTVKFCAEKQDGVIIDLLEPLEDGTAMYSLPQTMASVAGDVKLAYLALYKENYVATTQCVLFEVLEAVDEVGLVAYYSSEFEELKERMEQLTAEVEEQEAVRIEAENARAEAETKRVEAEQGRVDAEQSRVDAEKARVEAEKGRVAAENERVKAEFERVTNEGERETSENERETSEAERSNAEVERGQAESERVQAEEKRAADFAQMMDAAQGLTTYICQEGEYDTTTLQPTVSGVPTKIYLVPTTNGTDDNSYLEWMYLSGSWEKIGTTGTIVTPIDTDTIDSIVDGTSQSGSESLSTTGLSYFFSRLWNKATGAFAALSHTHTAADLPKASTSELGVVMVDGETVRIDDEGVISSARSSAQAGVIYPYAGVTVPDGFLACNGREVSRADYAALFAAIGTVYGEGDGSTTFNLPNLNGRVVVGADDSYSLASVGGEATHKLTVEEMPSHRHPINRPPWYKTEKAEGNNIYSGTSTTNETVLDEGKNIQPTGGDQPHNNMQPYMALNFIISTGKTLNVDEIIQGVNVVPLAVEYGGSGATNAEEARNNIGALEAPEGGAAGQVLTKTEEGVTWDDAKGASMSMPGAIYPFAGDIASVPQGYLLCDGAAVSRETYSSLFDVIGTTYGEGDGSTTFNLPNLQSRVPVGASDSYVLGATGGEETHKLTDNEMPAHKHSATTASAGAHTHSVTDSSEDYQGSWVSNASAGSDWRVYTPSESSSGRKTYLKTASAGSHTHTVTVNNAGGNGAHNNMQPYQVVNYIIATGDLLDVADIVSGVSVLPLGVQYGGTGATTQAEALANLGITISSEEPPATGTPGTIYIKVVG